MKNLGQQDKQDIGNRIRMERERQGLSQEQLAEIMGISQNYIACIESGRQNMSLAKVLELSNFIA